MATPAQLAEKGGMARPSPPSSSRAPPQLPPRANTVLGPPPYSPEDPAAGKMPSVAWQTRDPRRLSTDSLYPSRSGPSRRRTLLLVYIHGFMGTEASFQSFPAHVHNLLTVALSETHVVHTKMYPRYRSRKTIEFARDEFSSWLQPNTRYGTDIILLGHSMGGLLAAEVALKPSNTPATGQPFYHRILGTVNFDTPFLGIHPGVISSGLSSLFRPAPEPADPERRPSATGSSTPSGSELAMSPIGGDGFSPPSLSRSMTSPLSTPSLKDPSFDPPFPNDIRIKERTAWSGFMHFVNKHSDNLTSATKQYFVSHLEFGACLADYPGLKNRCDRLHALEDVDELAGLDRPGYRRPVQRIRFVNYYTASTGRPKPPKAQVEKKAVNDESDGPIEVEMHAMTLDYPTSPSIPSAPTSPMSARFGDPMASMEQLNRRPATSHTQNHGRSFRDARNVEDEYEEPLDMQHIAAEPIEDDWNPVTDSSKEDVALSSGIPSELDIGPVEPPLPPIPDVPIQPDPIDLSLFTDKDARKIAEKEHKRLTKAYQQAVKHRESAIKDRKKLADKREKKARQDLEKQMKADEAKRMKEEKEAEKRKATPVPPTPTSPGFQSPMSPLSPQPKPESRSKKDKKFCMLPPKRGGKRDQCWVRVHMEGVDEVGAHCGLFLPGAQYEKLVRDVGDKVVTWVHEDAARRIALEGQDD